jgi:glucose/arabinose dehydrogenase
LKNALVLLIMAAGAIAGIVLTFSSTPSGGTDVASDQGDRLELYNAGLKAELVAEGLEYPTSMRFLDDGSIMVLQKNDGEVRLVSDGKLLKEPVLQVHVASEGERGLLGIAVWNGDNNTSVFLYLTEEDAGKMKNRVYKYTYDEERRTLTNRTLILDLPGDPGPYHDGGKIAIGPRDGRLYAVIGDLSAGGGMLDNQIPGRPLDDQSVVLRVDRNTGAPVEDNPFYQYSGDMDKLKRYYAYGIRNSFGLDFDPVTGKLWMTENGPDYYDEINLVEPGFNSGWHKVIGPISRTNATVGDLVTFNGSKYADPVFSWYSPIGITDIDFFDSPKLGKEYENNIFVGDINNGNLYFFKVNQDRDGLELDSSGLSDHVADPVGNDIQGEVSPQIVDKFDGRITDIETGPDGYLYVLTYLDGRIWRIK